MAGELGSRLKNFSKKKELKRSATIIVCMASSSKSAPAAQQKTSQKGGKKYFFVDLKARFLELAKPVVDFYMKLSPRERIAYPLIAVGVVFIIIGVVLW
jgi:hypothetical protein